MTERDNIIEPIGSSPTQSKPMRAVPRPLICGVAWAALMGVLGILFLGVEYVRAVMASEPSPRFIANDQPISFGILLIVSFLFGFSLSWFLRRRRAAAGSACELNC
jgi:hypothetical protein